MVTRDIWGLKPVAETDCIRYFLQASASFGRNNKPGVFDVFHATYIGTPLLALWDERPRPALARASLPLDALPPRARKGEACCLAPTLFTLLIGEESISLLWDLRHQ